MDAALPSASPRTSTATTVPFRFLLLFAAVFAGCQLTFTGREVPDRETLQALGLLSSTASIQVRGTGRLLIDRGWTGVRVVDTAFFHKSSSQKQ